MLGHKPTVQINSRKFDGSLQRSWQAELLERADSLLTLVGVFEEQVEHSLLGVIRRGTVSYEFYWLNRGYNIFRFHEPEGNLRNFYCNLTLPPVFESNVMDYVDLDVDVVVWKDFSHQILDLDEFETNAEIFGYPETLRTEVSRNLKEIVTLIEQKSFPFNFK